MLMAPGVGIVPRLTKSDIEGALLSGAAVPWTDAGGKSANIQLATAKQRRLFGYLRGSKVRDVKGLPQTFIDGLAAAYVAVGDPAAASIQQTVNPSASGPWKIQTLKIEGFGGVNIWNGKPFELAIDGESLLIEGPNGSGKSSLNAAIIWALTGERPRDQGDSSLDEAKPVFDTTGKAAGAWPPVASYPPDLASLKTPPNVSVEIVFYAAGTQVSARRHFDGKNVTYTTDTALQIPSILLESGLLMPARIPHLRLDEGRGRLTDAVQKLTGLDELIELSAFIQGLCHSSRDYLAYKKAELSSSKAEFDKQLERARTALAPVSVVVSNFKPSDTVEKDGEMAKFGKLLNDKAAGLIATVSSDLAPDLVLADPKVQQRIVVALSDAEKDLDEGMSGLPTWKLVETIAAALPNERRATARSAVVAAKNALDIAISYFRKQEADTKFRLKAAGARWHNENIIGPIENCPLCDISMKGNPALKQELEALRSAGEAATRGLQDNINAIVAALEEAVPQNLRRLLDGIFTSQPRADVEKNYRRKFIEAERYDKCLVGFKSLATSALAGMPSVELTDATPYIAQLPVATVLAEKLDRIERMARLAEWHEAQEKRWSDWWAKLTPANDSEEKSLSSHLRHLSKSLSEAEPYRIGADALRLAWTHGRTAAAIEREQEKRQEIADDLAPLKQLGNLAEAQARNAITELSGRISAIHSATYIVDRLKFQEATLDKKTGLSVRGQLGENMRIDATLIANTSWLRGILWAFIHALREEAVEQIGGDVFPVIMLDDPQQTFDSEHRARWAEQIAKLQKTSPGVQILLTTHDDQFLSQLRLLGITGRNALICSAGEELGHIAILEGDRLDREWAVAKHAKTPAAAKDYIAGVREFVEGLLKLMLRGIDPSIPTAVMGACREKISELHDKGIEPWSQPAFKNLVSALAKGRKEIKWMEDSHHSGVVLSMNEASDVAKHWRETLRPSLERCFRIIRDHRALHGGLAALHAFPPSVTLPEGHKAKIGQFKLPLLGTAAALSDGRVADGCVGLTFATSSLPPVELKDHFIFRLTKPTLEPVARPGNLLLVRDHADATPLSLVIALHESQILARRLQIAGNHNDVAVLTASAINPRLTAAPVVAKLSTLTMKKVVGLFFDTGKTIGGQASEMEVVECGGEAAITTILSRAKGLVEVSGHSAEPQALDKQFLIIGDPLSLKDAEKTLDGRPVIAEDSDQSRYFKRLRVETNSIILESLEIGGDFPPILLARTTGLLKHLTKVWPVLGVLFEKP
jgi:energy-coupling factor transporter ATP-binding protein EcfA2